MDKNNPAIRSLLEANEEFRRLFREHETLEKELADLDKYHYLSPQQELERKKIQKIKLKGKDRMEEIIRLSRTETGTS
jgi:uncharacterized protein YdcH (DUF465 family)